LTMQGWYRLAFTQAQALAFSNALQRVHDTLRHANWPPDVGVFVSDDLVSLVGGEPSLLIYFPPASIDLFGPLINELDGQACLQPLPFGLDVHGNASARSLLG